VARVAEISAARGADRRRRRAPRPHKVTVRLSDAELAVIQQRAGEMGLTLASYLAEIGQAARPAAVPNESDDPGRTGGHGHAGGHEAGGDNGHGHADGHSGHGHPDGHGRGHGGRLVAERGRPLGVVERRGVAAELFGVHRLLVGVSTNLNQLAKVANSTGRVPAEVPVAAAAVSRYLPRLKAVVAALDPRAGA
jgi:mobilization protein NikA/mobilization protein MobC